MLPCALQTKDTPLHLAALSGETDTVEALLQHRANIEAKNKVSDTLQHALPEGSEGRGAMRAACVCEGYGGDGYRRGSMPCRPSWRTYEGTQSPSVGHTLAATSQAVEIARAAQQ